MYAYAVFTFTFYVSPPLAACIFGMSRLYFPCRVNPGTLYLYRFYIYPFCSRSIVSRCIPRCPAVSVRI